MSRLKRICVFNITVMLSIWICACTVPTASVTSTITSETISSATYDTEESSSIPFSSEAALDPAIVNAKAIFLDVITRSYELTTWVKIDCYEDPDPELECVFDDGAPDYPDGFYWIPVKKYASMSELLSAFLDVHTQNYVDVMLNEWSHGTPPFREIDGHLYICGAMRRDPNRVFAIDPETVEIISVTEDIIIAHAVYLRGNDLYEYELVWEREKWVLVNEGGAPGWATAEPRTR